LFSDNKLSEASGGDINSSEQNDLEEDNDGDGELENGVIDAVPVDENLFTGEDLDELEEELNTLDLEEWIKKLKWGVKSMWQSENWLRFFSFLNRILKQDVYGYPADSDGHIIYQEYFPSVSSTPILTMLTVKYSK